MKGTWIPKGLFAILLLATAAVATATPQRVIKQAEASMVLTGQISVDAEGKVTGYAIDHEDKVPAYVLSSIAKWVPDWRFKPVLVDGKAVPARAKMSLRMLAKPVGDDSFQVSIVGSSFGEGDAQETDGIRHRNMSPPRYPHDLVVAGAQGTAYLVLKIGRDGKVEDVVVERVNLTVYSSKPQMKQFRKRLGDAAANAARRWTFVPPTTGKLAGQPFWSVRVPVSFSLGEGKTDYGQWVAYLPGPSRRAPWLDDADTTDALADGAVQMVGTGLVLLTSLQG